MRDFFDAKDEKISDKAFSQSLIISVACIVLCIIALCSATYAWFTTTTTSDNNTLVAGSFDLDAAVTYLGDTASLAQSLAENSENLGENSQNNTATTPESITVIRDEKGVMSCTLEKIGTYEIILTMAAESTVKGFCGVSVDNGVTYLSTSPLGILIGDTTEKVTTLKFTVTITQEKVGTVLQLKPKWGYPAEISIKDGETYPWTVNSDPILNEGENL